MFKDTSQGKTHWTCNNRLEKERGDSKCCDCVPHENCGNRKSSDEVWDEELKGLEIQMR